MTQPSLLDVVEPRTLTEAVADVFRAQPGRWVSMQSLAKVGGCGGWRTRLSECRFAPFNMVIENRTRRVRTEDGRTVTVSEYRWVK